ncbi:hypothetical protein [Okeania sp. SIO1I7]|uniref:hypothetical protein n=1 Tax=Okeania sp. SIO1I7 TaxID=2607772 RepID=UPI0013F8CFED|nr:hypothetical protein [Okeania sp. SIO1I7]NET28854.1 hypothetical protein [Okeania sp. SIO1I7]
MKPRQLLLEPMGFEFPSEELEMASWSQTFINAWHDYICETGNHLKATFEDVEEVLFQQVHAYIYEGMILNTIRFKRLYEEKKVYSFKEYCEKFYPKSNYRALETIYAAQIGWELLCNEFHQIPTNVSQCIALSKTFLKDSFGQPDIVQSWKWVLEYSKTTGKKITAGLINFLVNPTKEEEKVKVKISKKKWDKLKRKAELYGSKAEDLLEALIDEFVYENSSGSDAEAAPEPESINNSKVSMSKAPETNAWEEDLEALVQEKNANEVNYDTTADSQSIPEVFHPTGDISPGDKRPIRRPPT